MVEEGRLKCAFGIRLSDQEQMEWDLLCNELGPYHGFEDREDNVSFDGDFSVHKCYNLQSTEAVEVNFNKFLWKNSVPFKVSFMLWVIFHDSLPTKDMLQHRGIEVQDGLCVLCKQYEETADHIFLHCAYSHHIWSYFLKAFNISWVGARDMLSFFESWKFNALSGRNKKIWWKIIYVVPWHIWLERNSRTFAGRPKEEEELLMLIKQSIVLWFCDTNVFHGISISQILFQWDSIVHT
ncbi:uncharacterized protein LOC113359676 [Papaver somniferum]|uniref:uncharacterized protein LOC113359676 n=1 Tax=Papaver somniferum TaxID=3469 RepID=UPI000E6FCA5C|nr:uncharacterized protein LOC113359676 [Papaver somniferum]